MTPPKNWKTSHLRHTLPVHIVKDTPFPKKCWNDPNATNRQQKIKQPPSPSDNQDILTEKTHLHKIHLYQY